MRHYWFKPLRFWKICAAYYPVSGEGFAVTIGILCIGLALCLVIQSALVYLLTLIILAFIFDLICVRTGEYPSWWKRHAGLKQ